MRHGSFFSGIGGFDYAAEIMGWENVFHCEINTFGQKVLHHYWPKAICYADIKTTDFRKYKGKIDLVSGGFPCQPYSTAGKRKGKEDERHLWPEMLRAIREIAPTWIVGENVLGLVSWSGGLVFEEVQTDLEAEGYEVQAYVLPAAGVGAPHRRDRVWFVAHKRAATNAGSLRQYAGGAEQSLSGYRTNGEKGNASNPNGIIGCEGRMYEDGPEEAKRHASTRDARHEWNAWEIFPTQSPVCNGNDGISFRLDATSLFEGRKPRNGNPFGKWRTESIKAAGNAVVPHVVLQIFRSIEQFQKLANDEI